MIDKDALDRRLEIVESVAHAWTRRSSLNDAAIEMIQPYRLGYPDGPVPPLGQYWTAICLSASVRCHSLDRFWWTAQLTLSRDWLIRASDSDVRDCVKKFLRPPITPFVKWL